MAPETLPSPCRLTVSVYFVVVGAVQTAAAVVSVVTLKEQVALVCPLAQLMPSQWSNCAAVAVSSTWFPAFSFWVQVPGQSMMPPVTRPPPTGCTVKVTVVWW